MNIQTQEDIAKNLIIVRGGGDIATGSIARLYRCGFPVLILEIPNPSAIRRNVAFSEAVYQGTQTVEDVTCTLVQTPQEAEQLLREGGLPLLVDPDCTCLSYFQPMALVDGILAKRNLGTNRQMAPITVALGPGFTAGAGSSNENLSLSPICKLSTSEAAAANAADVDAVIETKRGHNLGRVIYEGAAAPNTGVPGKIAGFDKERVIHSPAEGILRNVHKITDLVKKGEVIAVIETEDGEVPVLASLDGLLRGLIRDGYPVTKGFKIADIDPRADEYNNCFTISDKARCIAGGTVEAILHLKTIRGL